MRISEKLKDPKKRTVYAVSISLLFFFIYYIATDIKDLIFRFLFHNVNRYLTGKSFEFYLNCLLPVTTFLIFYLIFNALKRRFDDDEFVFQHINSACRKIIDRLLNPLLATITVLYFATWLPHYLFWPWWMDQDHFAVSAMSWQNGIIPYRDLIDFNFPFPIYFNWVIGQIFGWGRPMVINTIDALLLISLVPVLTWWSRSLFQSRTTGICAIFLIVYHYCSLDYSRVMQRDWHVVYLAIISLCLLQVEDFKFKFHFIAILMAVACNTRPYAVLAFPALLSAMTTAPHLPGTSRIRNAITFLIVFILSSVLLWLPLLLQGTLDDFGRNFWTELNKGSYQSAEKTTISKLIYVQLNRNLSFTALIGIILSLSTFWKDQNCRSTIITWLIAFGCFLFYMPACPVRHAYTDIPFEMIAALCFAISFGFLIKSGGPSPVLKCSIVAYWVYLYFPGWPIYSSFQASEKALVALARWEPLQDRPNGTNSVFATDEMKFYRYRWSDYQKTIQFLRENTTQNTAVGNFLRSYPFPAINGMTGRMTTWPCGEGIMWLRGVPGSSESDFAANLEKQKDAVIVWHDRGENFPLENKFGIIEQKIRQYYEPLTRIGDIDIWTRKKTTNPSDKPAG